MVLQRTSAAGYFFVTRSFWDGEAVDASLAIDVMSLPFGAAGRPDSRLEPSDLVRWAV